MENKTKIDVSGWTIVKIVLILVLFYLVFYIRDILALLFFVLILVAAFLPVVERWQKKIGRGWSVFILFIIVVSAITGFIYLIIPPLIDQTGQLIANIPDYLRRYSALKDHFPTIETATQNISKNIGSLTGNVISITVSFFGGLVNFFTVIVLTFYMLLDKKVFSRLESLIPAERRDDISDLIEKISLKIGDWLRGQLLLGLIMGTLTFVGLSIIGIPYALTLGVVAGTLEILPIVGPLISGIFASLVALTISPVSVVLVAAYAIVLQLLENNFIAPKVLQKAIGLPPAVIIIAIIIGGKLLGLVGGLMAVPISAIIYVLLRERNSLRINKRETSE